MSFVKIKAVIVGTACALCPLSAVFAEEPAAAEPTVNVEMETEIGYIQALVDGGFSDFAGPVIEATRKRWPESEVKLFAIDVRSLLALGKFDEAERKIAALPDRKGSKYWAARLELANNYSMRNRKEEGKKIYEEFFRTFANPPRDLITFYMNACYQWAQLLVMDKRWAEASGVYDRLLKQKLSVKDWCMMGTEACEIDIRLATEAKDAKKREGYLATATSIADRLLDHPEEAICFGRAVAMKAHIELMRGKVSVAQDIMEEYLPQLGELHENIVQFDPDGRQGLRKMSPLPQCRFLMAQMLWKAAQDEYRAKKRDDEKVKEYLFGAKAANGRRNNMGAFNHALNVFLKYPESTWAAQAGELSEQVRAFAEEKYGAKIKTNVTPEMIANIRAQQWRAAADKVLAGDLAGGIKDYRDQLGQYPELPESIAAVEAVLDAYLTLWMNAKGEKDKDYYRLCADAVAGYLSERFAGHPDRAVMAMAGDAVVRAAGKEKERGQPARASALRRAFATNYRGHANAAPTAAGLAGEAQKEERWAEAIELWDIVGRLYTNSAFYANAYMQSSVCWEKLDEREKALEALKRYVSIEDSAVRRLGAQMRLAQMYQKAGFEQMKASEGLTNETETVQAQKVASAQIIRGIQQFRNFGTEIDTLLANDSLAGGDRDKLAEYREIAMFLAADCWARLRHPASKLEMLRRNAAKGFEAYVKAYPSGQYAKFAYVKLGMIYTALGEMENSKAALDRLTKAFPDSEEAKNAKPSLAKALIEMGLQREGAEIYKEMLSTDGAYTPVQFVNAGEALIEARSWELANRAFEKAIRLAGTNFASTVARARIGEAKALFKQDRLAEARDALDTFLEDEKMSRLMLATEAYQLMVEVASKQGSAEADDAMRAKHFGAAVGAVKKLRSYWSKKPRHEQDEVDLMSADVMVRRMQAELAMNLAEQADETCRKAAAMLQSFLQARAVSADNPFDKLSPGDRSNLERCYATMVPLLSRLGAEQSGRVLRYGREYLDLFPQGKARTDIVNCMNKARAESSSEAAPAPAAPAAAEAEPAEAE